MTMRVKSTNCSDREEDVESTSSGCRTQTQSPSPNNSISKKVPYSKSANCFVCNVNTKVFSDLELDTSTYPKALYCKIFNHFAKALAIKNSQKKIVELSPDRAKSVHLCVPCHGQLLQLYRLSNSPNSKAPSAQEQIQEVTNLLKFKVGFAKRNNSKIRSMVTAHLEPTKYHVNGYWNLKMAEQSCAREVYNTPELSSILTRLDISKLLSNGGIYEESIFYVTSPDIEDPSSSPAEDEDEDESDEKLTYRYPETSDFDLEDEDDMGTGGIDPMDLVQVDMDNEFPNSRDTSGSDSGGSPIFNVPPGEIKPPRKQVIATRVGVSKQAPIFKTITRDKAGNKRVEEIPVALPTTPKKVKKETLKLKKAIEDDEEDDMELDIYSDTCKQPGPGAWQDSEGELPFDLEEVPDDSQHGSGEEDGESEQSDQDPSRTPENESKGAVSDDMNVDDLNIDKPEVELPRKFRSHGRRRCR